jgi:3-hexulose-6-phosphate synthase
MKLQLAFDLGSFQDLILLLEQVEDLIDIIEIGTPLIVKEGVKEIENIKKTFPKKTILADMKIMDAGELEAKIGFDVGADIVTCLGLASSTTIAGAKKVASRTNGKIMVDMINHYNPISKWPELLEMGIDYCCLHTAHDDAVTGDNSIEILEQFHKIYGGNNLAVAGRVNPDLIQGMSHFQPEIVVVGSYITDSTEPREAVEKVRRVMK